MAGQTRTQAICERLLWHLDFQGDRSSGKLSLADKSPAKWGGSAPLSRPAATTNHRIAK